jgi:hypothetical protein
VILWIYRGKLSFLNYLCYYIQIIYSSVLTTFKIMIFYDLALPCTDFYQAHAFAFTICGVSSTDADHKDKPPVPFQSILLRWHVVTFIAAIVVNC